MPDLAVHFGIRPWEMRHVKVTEYEQMRGWLKKQAEEAKRRG